MQGCSGGPLLWDRCDRCNGVAQAGWARVVRERKRAEREKKSKEQAGVLGVARGGCEYGTELLTVRGAL